MQNETPCSGINATPRSDDEDPLCPGVKVATCLGVTGTPCLGVNSTSRSGVIGALHSGMVSTGFFVSLYKIKNHFSKIPILLISGANKRISIKEVRAINCHDYGELRISKTYWHTEMIR